MVAGLVEAVQKREVFFINPQAYSKKCLLENKQICPIDFEEVQTHFYSTLELTKETNIFVNVKIAMKHIAL